MSFDDGILLSCAGGTAWAALSLVRPGCDDVLVVFGLDPVGLMAVMWGRAMGAYVIGVETSGRRLALAGEMGAHKVINAAEADPVEEIMDLTESGATVGFDAAGTAKAQVDVLRATDRAARVVYVAVGAHGPLIDPDHGRKLRKPNVALRSISGSFTFAVDDWYRMIRAVTLHELQPGAAVTHRFALAQADQAYAVADSGDCGKVVFSWA
jgi:threonine dehydrogenase-like Zn-dependent dehydrogenase